jgi:hypothetical protein
MTTVSGSSRILVDMSLQAVLVLGSGMVLRKGCATRRHIATGTVCYVGIEFIFHVLVFKCDSRFLLQCQIQKLIGLGSHFQIHT